MDKVHWVAGPVKYEISLTGCHPNLQVELCKWHFIGGTASGEIFRRVLNFRPSTRKFHLTIPATHRWEESNWGELANLYRPISVLRSDLPKGSLSKALQKMLSPRQYADISAIAILRGRGVTWI